MTTREMRRTTAALPPRSAAGSSAGATPFETRHIGPRENELEAMLDALGAASLDALSAETVPSEILSTTPLELSPAATEEGMLEELRELAQANRVTKSFIGTGYSDCFTPGVILRNVLENPGFYTAYTPYQAEISQGRLELLLNFQTVVSDLTGLELANASLLDEATAAAEAMSLCHAACRDRSRDRFLVSRGCHPQTIAVVKTRAEALGIDVVLCDGEQASPDERTFGLLLQYPETDGRICDFEATVERFHDNSALVAVAADLLSLTLLEPPGEWGADVVVGSTQRFGMPMGFGGPHAAYFATRIDFKRQIPGRLVGVTRDAAGAPAVRLALQTREQHIRRDRATSNICTAQVLPAVVAACYAIYHGAEGLAQIAARIHQRTAALYAGLERAGFTLRHELFFDTIRVDLEDVAEETRIVQAAVRHGANLRSFGDGSVGVSIDETTQVEDIEVLLRVFREEREVQEDVEAETLLRDVEETLPRARSRRSAFLTQDVFTKHRSETEMLRYLKRLEHRDLSLTTSMIPLGSCTMKLNATAEMAPITWPEFARMHPYAPAEQTAGYLELARQLEQMLAEITGFDAVSLQPNAGSQGELAGLLVIRKYLEANGRAERNVCLIPTSAHGTNPASAVMAGMKVVPVACDDNGNIDVEDLKRRAEEHADDLAALMVTYPSTHGVFEAAIREVCEIVHSHGGQVYLDGANLNAQVGLCRPGDYGADVCHLNLHKTFCIPHGGGGPGMGPIAVAPHLAPHLPSDPAAELRDDHRVGPISAAALGSGCILPISWAYIRMMGPDALRRASQIAILSANYIAHRLDEHYPVLYRGHGGRVAHECILDLRHFKKVGVDAEDVAKRLIDFGFHAPTMSFPVAGTLMVEPTESEGLDEIDRFCDAMIAIREEIREVENDEIDVAESPLRHAPHTAREVMAETWQRSYSRARAAYPAPWLDTHKYWPPVQRIDNAFGDRNLVCTCVGMEAFAED